MSYQTILVHIDAGTNATHRTRVAYDVAKQFNAHLIGVALTGISRYLYESNGIIAGDPNISIHLGALRERAEKATEQFKNTCDSLPNVTTEVCIANDEANGGLGLRANYCDLIVIGQNDRDEPSPSVLSDFPEFMVTHAGRPILLVPHKISSTNAKSISDQILIAWDGSREAARAISDALPFLKQSKLVHLLILNPNDNADLHGEEPGADMALYLARHKIQVEVTTRFTQQNKGESILRIAAELGSTMIVMGGYGHSRFREMLMGGVTRSVMENMNIPVLMSH